MKHIGLLLAGFVVCISLVICGFVASDALGGESTGGGQTAGTIAGIAEIQQAISRAPSTVQNLMAVAAVIVIILVAFFLVIPAKAANDPKDGN